MNPKQLLFKILSGTTFAAILLLSSSILFAQVKIGTAPTTIDPNNNLEVQGSTTGRKLTVDKNTGKMTYADGTQGVERVLTSDANGGASWQFPLSGSMVQGETAGYVTIPTGAGINTRHTYSGASITFLKAGTYIVYARWQMGVPTTTYVEPGHCFVNTVLSTSTSTDTETALAAQWVFAVNGAQNSAPGFRVTVTAGETLYFWYWTAYFSGTIRMLESYAVGPF